MSRSKEYKSEVVLWARTYSIIGCGAIVYDGLDVFKIEGPDGEGRVEASERRWQIYEVTPAHKF